MAIFFVFFFKSTNEVSNSLWSSIVIGFLIAFTYRASGKGRCKHAKSENTFNVMPSDSIDKNSNKSIDEDIMATFEDVAGHKEVKKDLKFLIDFMKNPEKYKEMGARMPKGLIFYGPPGTGKLC